MIKIIVQRIRTCILVLLVFIRWIVIYPVDSAIHRLNNWGLVVVAVVVVKAPRYKPGKRALKKWKGDQEKCLQNAKGMRVKSLSLSFTTFAFFGACFVT